MDGETKETQMGVVVFRVAKEFDVVAVKISTPIQEHLTRCEREGLCPCCREKLEGKTVRGCHKSCADSLYNLIDKKKKDRDGNLITDEYLIKKGKWRVQDTPGPKTKNKGVLDLIGDASTDAVMTELGEAAR